MSYPTPPEWQPVHQDPYGQSPQSIPPHGQQPTQPVPYGYPPQSVPPYGQQPGQPVPYGQPASPAPYSQPASPAPYGQPYPPPQYPQQPYSAAPYPVYPQPVPGAVYPPGQGPYGHQGAYSVTRQYIGPSFHIKHLIAVFFTCGLWLPFYLWAWYTKSRPQQVTTYHPGS